MIDGLQELQKELKSMKEALRSNLFANDKALQIDFTPQAGKQEKAFNYITDNTTNIIAYGGSKGCGKTEIGIGGTITRAINNSSFNGLYLRRTTKSLAEVVKRIKTMLIKSNIKYQYNGTDKIFILQNGATLRIFYTDGDGLDSLQGSNINHLVIEEPQLMPNLEDIMLKIKAFWRSSNKDIIPKMILLFNPLGPGTKFLKTNFVDKGEKLFKNQDGFWQVFIRASLQDNPILLKNNKAYVQMLKNYPKKIRQAWLEGDFSINSGVAFEILTKDHNGIVPFNLGHQKWFVSLDWGFREPCAVGFYMLYDGAIVIKFDEIRTVAKTPAEVAGIIKAKIHDLKPTNLQYMVADPSIFSNVSGLSIAQQFGKEGLHFIKADNNREAGFLRMYAMVKNKQFLAFNNLEYFWESVPKLILDENKQADISQNPKQDDHAYDETRYAIMSAMLE